MDRGIIESVDKSDPLFRLKSLDKLDGKKLPR